MKVVALLLLCVALASGLQVNSDLEKDAAQRESKCAAGSEGFECRRNIRCGLRKEACEGHCRKTKGKNVCTDLCFKQMVLRACNHCVNADCRAKRAACFTSVKMCQAKCTTAKCRSSCRCTGANEPGAKHPKVFTSKCPPGTAGYSCRRKHRCHLRHKACHMACLKTKTKPQCRDICYAHLVKRACNSCHDPICRTARSNCFRDLKMCQAKCTTAKCRQDCRCSKHTVVHPTSKGTKCPKGTSGYNCRRLQRCKQRHVACHKGCASTGKLPGQCKDVCYAHMKKHACNGCHDDKCRVERRQCFTELKACQAKCTTSACRNACKCSLNHVVKPHVVKPHVVKPAVTHGTPPVVMPVDNTCHCAKKVKICKFHKECNLRTPVKVKKCVEQAMTKIVYCQCEQYAKNGQCLKKKMEKMCTEHDKAGKCTKVENKCVPICHKEKCLQTAKGKDGKLHCLQSLCEKEDASHALRCVKYSMENDYKCTQSGYSHKCSWQCEEKKCGNKVTHLLSKTEEKTRGFGLHAIKIYDHTGKELSEADMHVLAVKDPAQFQNILKSMESAESVAHDPNQAQEIKTAEAKLESFGR